MFTLQDFRTEEVTKGKNTYTKAIVVYNDPKYGQKEKTVMSFANPAVFAALKKLAVGDTFSVTVTKNGEYTNWTSVTTGGEAANDTATPNKAAPQTPVRSSYETPEERAARQVLIVKQSSLSAAVATLSPGAKGPLDKVLVLGLAQEYVDWVMGNKFGDRLQGSELPGQE